MNKINHSKALHKKRPITFDSQFEMKNHGYPRCATNCMTYPSQQDNDIMRSLIHQVSKAVPVGGTEQDVVTFISAPMWKAFCRSTNMPEDSVPSIWKGKDTNRVYGSLTVVIPSKDSWSYSKPMLPATKHNNP